MKSIRHKEVEYNEEDILTLLRLSKCDDISCITGVYVHSFLLRIPKYEFSINYENNSKSAFIRIDINTDILDLYKIDKRNKLIDYIVNI